MSNIFDIYIHQKVENLSSLTTLIIEFQKAPRIWDEFLHQLAIIAESIVGVCILKQPSIRQHIPWKIIIETTQDIYFVTPCLFGMKKKFVLGEMLEELIS